jgi:hypothetical protein
MSGLPHEDSIRNGWPSGHVVASLRKILFPCDRELTYENHRLPIFSPTTLPLMLRLDGSVWIPRPLLISSNGKVQIQLKMTKRGAVTIVPHFSITLINAIQLRSMSETRMFNRFRILMILIRILPNSHGIDDPKEGSDLFYNPRIQRSLPREVIYGQKTLSSNNDGEKYRCLKCPSTSSRTFIFNGVRDHLRAKYVYFLGCQWLLTNYLTDIASKARCLG